MAWLYDYEASGRVHRCYCISLSVTGFAKEVTRVKEEVGSQGVLGGQAEVPDVEGVWKELTTNVNKVLISIL